MGENGDGEFPWKVGKTNKVSAFVCASVTGRKGTELRPHSSRRKRSGPIGTVRSGMVKQRNLIAANGSETIRSSEVRC